MTALILEDYLKVTGDTATSLAKKIGVTQQLVSWWVRSGKADIYVDYNIVTKEISKVFSQTMIYRKPTRWDAHKKALDTESEKG